MIYGFKQGMAVAFMLVLLIFVVFGKITIGDLVLTSRNFVRVAIAIPLIISIGLIIHDVFCN